MSTEPAGAASDSPEPEITQEDRPDGHSLVSWQGENLRVVAYLEEDVPSEDLQEATEAVQRDLHELNSGRRNR